MIRLESMKEIVAHKESEMYKKIIDRGEVKDWLNSILFKVKIV